MNPYMDGLIDPITGTQTISLAAHGKRVRELEDTLTIARDTCDSLADTVAAIAKDRDAAIRRYEDESIVLADMTRQRDYMRNIFAANLTSSDPISDWAEAALMYCNMKEADRARDAQEQDGQRAAADEAAPGSAEWWADAKEIPY